MVSVYADEKPGNPGHHYGEISNPGHHYGQLKHKDAQTPPPATSRPPATSSTPPGHVSSGLPSSDPAPAAGIPDLASTLPVSNVLPRQATAKTPPVSRDWTSWLILLILPALVAVWLMVFARAALTAARLRGTGPQAA